MCGLWEYCACHLAPCVMFAPSRSQPIWENKIRMASFLSLVLYRISIRIVFIRTVIELFFIITSSPIRFYRDMCRQRNISINIFLSQYGLHLYYSGDAVHPEQVHFLYVRFAFYYSIFIDCSSLEFACSEVYST